jgi:hypothetical protein
MLVPIPRDQLLRMALMEEKIRIADAIEGLAKYCAAPFSMPRTNGEKEALAYVLRGVSEGFCQLVCVAEEEGVVKVKEKFVPLPALKEARPEKLLPRGEALFALRDVLNQLHSSRFDERKVQGSKPGIGLEAVAVASMLLMARCRERFSLDQLCERGSNGVSLGDSV